MLRAHRLSHLAPGDRNQSDLLPPPTLAREKSKKLRDPGLLSPRSPHHGGGTFADLLRQLDVTHRREVEALKQELKRAHQRLGKQESSYGQLPTKVGASHPQVLVFPQDGIVRDLPGTVACVEMEKEDGAASRHSGSSKGSEHTHRQSTPEGWKSESSDEDDQLSRQSRSLRPGEEQSIKWNMAEHALNPLTELILKFFNARGEDMRKKRLAYKVVKSVPFSIMSYVAIILNSLFLGASMQMQLERAIHGSTGEPWWDYIELLFVVFFTLELICKALAEDLYMFTSNDCLWNILDVFLVIAALTQLMMESAAGGSTPNLTISRTVRLFRITRVLRIIRVVRICQSLRVMIFAIFRSLDALFWVLAVLLFFKYIFAMIFIHGAIERFYDVGSEDALESDLYSFFGNMYRAIVTLFESITGGRDWSEVYQALQGIHEVYGVIFLMYIYFMVFLVLNVVIGTVVDVTSGVSSRDRDRLVAQQVSRLKEYTQDIKEFFAKADKDKSGQLSWEEFKDYLQDDQVKAYFQTLDLDIRQAHILFTLLDCNDNGEVGISEFLDGCLRLKGQARSLDLNLVVYQLEALIKGTNLLTAELAASSRTLRSDDGAPKSAGAKSAPEPTQSLTLPVVDVVDTPKGSGSVASLRTEILAS